MFDDSVDNIVDDMESGASRRVDANKKILEFEFT
jgi:hypothetical protein